jgi:uncharacterized membrane protein
MRARSFFLQWLLNIVVLLVVALVLDLIFGDTESITSPRRITWLLVVSLIFTVGFYRKKDAKNR